MSGWENNQGMYFINKLQQAISSLSDKFEALKLPNAPKSNGLYNLKKTSDGTSWVKIADPPVPTAPSEDGTYKLVVSSGTATWVAEQ